MKKKVQINKKLLCLLSFTLLWNLQGSRADVIFSTTNIYNNNSLGAINSHGWVGDEVRLDTGGAVITSLQYYVRSTYSSSPGTQVIRFFNIDAGSDGLTLTADDQLGTEIGSATLFASQILTTGWKTFSGFSVEVPKNFAWVIENTAGSLSYSIGTFGASPTTGEHSAVGGTFNDSFSYYYYFNSNQSEPLVAGVPTYSTSSSPAVEFGGTTIPEPASATLIALVAGISLWIRRRFEV